MVHGIFTIPLRGRKSGLSAGPEAARYPFSEFVAGPENRLTNTALQGFMQRAATTYSPLVLYGPHGAGKSHLAHGLIDWWVERYPDARVLYLPAGDFVKQYNRALEEHRLDEWRAELEGLSLFVLDDVGQLANKEAAQHELTRLLDEWTDRDALVVVVGRSRAPHAAVRSPTLSSRLSAGLAVPVALPGLATRRTILQELAKTRQLDISRRMIDGLASSLPASVPALVSALLELELHGQLAGQPVDSRQLRDLVAERREVQAPTLREIATRTAKYFGLKLADLKSPQRRQPLVAARGVAMYLARQLTDKSLGQIGEFFGGRDHTTVLHGCRRTEGLMARDRATRQALADIKRLLHAP